jgi:hypothetical protein
MPAFATAASPGHNSRPSDVAALAIRPSRQCRQPATRRSSAANLPSPQAKAPSRVRPRRVDAPSSSAAVERAQADQSPLRHPPTPASSLSRSYVDAGRPVPLATTPGMNDERDHPTTLLPAGESSSLARPSPTAASPPRSKRMRWRSSRAACLDDRTGMLGPSCRSEKRELSGDRRLLLARLDCIPSVCPGRRRVPSRS